MMRTVSVKLTSCHPNSSARFLGTRLMALLLFGAAQSVSAQCLQSVPMQVANRVTKTTGNPGLDSMFNGEANSLKDEFGVNPNMLLLDDSMGANASASCADTMPGYFGTVQFGVRLIAGELWRMDHGPVAVQGIMAHEWAHVLQCRLHSDLVGKDKELHADFMAGYYLSKRSTIARGNLGGFARSLFEKGDYNFRDPNHHGTPDERVTVMVAGYSCHANRLADAYEEGERLVKGTGEERRSGGTDKGRYRVILQNDDRVTFSQVISAIVDLTDISEDDASHIARRADEVGRATLVDDMERDRAERLVTRLKSRGIPARVEPDKE